MYVPSALRALLDSQVLEDTIIVFDGHAKIVRPFEYLNGMLNGTFPSPADPIDYRRERRREKLMGRDNAHRFVNQYGPPSNPANRDSHDTYYREPLFPEFQTNFSYYEDLGGS